MKFCPAADTNNSTRTIICRFYEHLNAPNHPKMKQTLHRIGQLISLVTLITVQLISQKKSVDPVHLNREGVALAGYDPVSYFEGSPLLGKAEYSHEDRGILYWFSSRENRDRLAKDPGRYEPAFGGWCAYAMALKGQQVEVDPLTYKIVDGRLLLFYNKRFTNTLELWNELPEPESKYLQQADSAWNGIIRRN